MTENKGYGEAIRRMAAERYPCQAIPYGAMAEIAKELGCSRQRVVTVLGAYERGRADRARTYCACGKELPNRQRALCLECRFVTLPCGECGSGVRRSAAALATKAKTYGERFTGIVFCNRECRDRYARGRPRGW